MVGIIRDIEITSAIYRHTDWIIQLSTGSVSAITTEARYSCTSNGTDGSIAGIYFAYTVISLVGDVYVSEGICRYAGWIVYYGTCSDYSVPNSSTDKGTDNLSRNTARNAE
ncbi:hypothetical protein GCM10023189_18760 [Nibrella saemangeumensis]|uniref:Uncharacterized protein n=1 Tax=Nibrella saemangeumensis TaxID=1084526 RepID=A0ABP8MS62_9BACT